MGKRQKRKRLESAVIAIQRRWGLRALRQGGQSLPSAAEIPCIPTGFAALDTRLGSGGLPRGKLTEIIGAPTSGMTTLALKVMASAQSQGDVVAYIDLGHTFDPDYAHRCEVDVSPERFLLVRPQHNRDALAISHSLIRSHSLGLVVVSFQTDPLADAARQPQLSSLLRQLNTPLARSRCVLLFLIPPSDNHPAPESYTFAPSAAIRLVLTKDFWIYRQGDIRGYQAQVTIVKNQFGQTGQVPISIIFNGTVRGDST